MYSELSEFNRSLFVILESPDSTQNIVMCKTMNFVLKWRPHWKSKRNPFYMLRDDSESLGLNCALMSPCLRHFNY